jgi:hypothetical protein
MSAEYRPAGAVGHYARDGYHRCPTRNGITLTGAPYSEAALVPLSDGRRSRVALSGCSVAGKCPCESDRESNHDEGGGDEQQQAQDVNPGLSGQH